MSHIFVIRFSLFLAPLLAGSLLPASPAPLTLPEVQASGQRDLEQALAELDDVRMEIAEERIPLARKLRELEQQVLEKRKEYERLRRINEREDSERVRRREEMQSKQQRLEQLDARLGEFVDSFEANLHVSELPRFQNEIEAARTNRLSFDDTIPSISRIGFLSTPLERLREQIGGRIFPGAALAGDGSLEEGDFIVFGPTVLFTNRDGRFLGIAGSRPGSLKPAVTPLRRDFAAGVEALRQTGVGEIPVDPTGGRAIRIEESRGSLLAHVKKGGVVMIPILLLAAGALTVAAIKWFQIAGMRAARPEDLEAILGFLRERKKVDARARAGAVRGPVGEMLVSAVEHADEERDLIEEVLWEKQLHAQPRLDRLLPFLALTAATAPLLGLLGTVTGMITTFNLITLFGSGDAQTLSGGISEALITTKFGLAVAIPALIAHALLNRKGKGILASMEQAAAGFINGMDSPSKTRAAERSPQ